MSIPSDPIMLLSFVNLKLRDFYPSLEALCNEIPLTVDELSNKLAKIDYVYDQRLNQFI